MMKINAKYSKYIYLVPSFIIILCIELIPAIYTFVVSFTKWDLLIPPIYVGFDNYIKLFTNPILSTAIFNTAAWVIGSLFLTVYLALILASFINSFNRFMKSLFTIIFVSPFVFAPTIAGRIWERIFSSFTGGINSLLVLFGLDEFTQSWLTLTGSKIVPLNTVFMIIASSWRFLGLNLLLFLVGLSSIPPAYTEAAEIDGANPRQIFYRITLPLLSPITYLVVANTLVNIWRMFAIPWVMTQGGPGRASETLAVTMYKESFLLFHSGLGAAIAVFIAITGLILSGKWLKGFDIR